MSIMTLVRKLESAIDASTLWGNSVIWATMKFRLQPVWILSLPYQTGVYKHFAEETNTIIGNGQRHEDKLQEGASIRREKISETWREKEERGRETDCYGPYSVHDCMTNAIYEIVQAATAGVQINFVYSFASSLVNIIEEKEHTKFSYIWI